jgi:DNA-binding FadR family transcriptional regulator
MEDHETVAATLSQRIGAGAFADGRLPTERELAESYAIPRSAVRKALAILEEEGLIVRSVGRGTFVSASQPVVFSTDDLNDISPADLNVARLLFEPVIAEMAAVQATAADLAEIRKCLEECEAAKDTNSFDFWDANLHMAIARATHSNFVVLTFKALHHVRQSAAWSHVKQFATTTDRLKNTMSDHRRIVESILKRDAVAARVAMRSHIEQVGRYIANRD